MLKIAKVFYYYTDAVKWIFQSIFPVHGVCIQINFKHMLPYFYIVLYA